MVAQMLGRQGRSQTSGYAGRRKAAALLIALGPELSSSILKSMSEDDIDEITGEIVRIRQVPSEVRDSILRETYEEAKTRQYITEGGSTYARDVLARALGTQKASEMLSRATGLGRSTPFDFVRQTELPQLVTVLEAEHPQTVAIVLAHLPADLTGRILSSFDYELQSEVASRLAQMTRTAPEVVKEVESVLKKKLASFATQGFRSTGGMDYLAKVLGSVDTSTERGILEAIEMNDPELATEIKGRLFTFEDMSTLDDRSIQRVLRDVGARDLALAMRGASEELKARIYRNMSSRAAAMLRDEIQAVGPVRLRLVEEAQQRIVNTIRTLQEAEEIAVARGAEDVFI